MMPKKPLSQLISLFSHVRAKPKRLTSSTLAKFDHFDRIDCKLLIDCCSQISHNWIFTLVRSFSRKSSQLEIVLSRIRLFSQSTVQNGKSGDQQKKTAPIDKAKESQSIFCFGFCFCSLLVWCDGQRAEERRTIVRILPFIIARSYRAFQVQFVNQIKGPSLGENQAVVKKIAEKSTPLEFTFSLAPSNYDKCSHRLLVCLPFIFRSLSLSLSSDGRKDFVNCSE